MSDTQLDIPRALLFASIPPHFPSVFLTLLYSISLNLALLLHIPRFPFSRAPNPFGFSLLLPSLGGVPCSRSCLRSGLSPSTFPSPPSLPPFPRASPPTHLFLI